MKLIKKMWWKFWGWIKPYLTPKMIPIVLILWFMVNGIWYAIAFAPIPFIPHALTVFAKAYLVILWAGTPEKALYLPLAVLIYRIIYKEKFVKIEEATHESNGETKHSKTME
jgi:hypothetical protein